MTQAEPQGASRLLDILTGSWAIVPDVLLELQAIYATHLRGDKIDIAAIEARIGRPLANEQQSYVLRDGGVAVLPITGILAPKANMLMRVSGMQSMQMLAEQVRSIRADPRVRSTIIAADSPGGAVLGVPALAGELRALAAEKPTVTVSEGRICSAMYWLGSAANAVFIEGETDMVGHIGVVMNHEYDPNQRTVSTNIVAGKYKRMGSSTAPLDKEGRAYLQSQVDQVYGVFVDAVAANRGVTADEVLERMADGRVFIGQQAIDAGLVDGVSTVEAMVDRLASNPDEFAQRRKAMFALGGLSEAHEDEPVLPVAIASNHTAEGNDMTQPNQPVAAALTRESMERDHAALFAQLRSEFRAEGANTERDRIKAVRDQAMPGHEKLIDQLAMDGKTTGPEAAVKVLQAHRESTAAAAKAHADDAPSAVPNANAPANEGKQDRSALAAQAEKLAAEKGIDIVAALKQLGVED
jgi:signal peptide peptidase SppA